MQLQRIGPYSIVRRLGAGGMAETYVAERRGPGDFVQRVCLKRIRADRAEDAELVRQFMAEAAITARLRHATLAQVLDFGEHEGELYLTTELVEGLDLRELLRKGPLPEPVVLLVAFDLCTALDVAHRAPGGPVVHRDVSPSNVLVSREGEIKLADFGIARSLASDPHTSTGIVRGKVPYLPPEYARTGHVDARGDLFSLGVLLYECVCGKRPYDGATDLETLERAARGERVKLSERAPSTSEDFAGLIDQLIEPAVERRFQTASALLEALLSLPSSPRARRELAALVVQRAPAEAADPGKTPAPAQLGPLSESPTERAPVGAHSRAGGAPGEAPTRTQVARPGASSVEAAQTPSGSMTWSLLAAILAASVGAAWWWQESRAAPLAADALPEASAQSAVLPNGTQPIGLEQADFESTREAVYTLADAGTFVTAGAASPQPDIAEGDTTRGGSVTVSVMPNVMPFSNVLVNGVARGPAPQTVWLPAGKHTVRVEGPGEALIKRVSLRAGQHLNVRFD